MSEEKVVFWSCDDACESLYHGDREDAIEEWLDKFLEPNMTPEQVLAALPEELEVYGYARMKPPTPDGVLDPDPDGVLERVLEDLDEVYGDPDAATKPTPAMKAAAQTFVDSIMAEYVSWACYCVHSEMVNVPAWIRENEPEWLEPTQNGKSTKVPR